MRTGHELRILCIVDEYPWPAASGYPIRLAAMVEALEAVGDVDLFCTVSERPELGGGEVRPAPHGLTRLGLHQRAALHSSPGGLQRWASSGWPRAVALREWRGAAAALAAFRRDPYDVVWHSHGEVWLALASPDDPPAIVDLDNLESAIMAGHAADPRDAGGGPLARLRAVARRRADAIDEGRWARAEWRAAEQTRRVIVCSEVDAARLGHPRTEVIPNGYHEVPASPPAGGAVLAMVSLLVYRPNLDGARWFASEVLPLVRRQVPAATLRLIGRHDGAADKLGALPGVELVGPVPDVGAALAGATAVVVPLHTGSGTRIKVLEAFARRLPVASTTLGCEGLGVEAGIHALTGDTPAELADACVVLLTDPTRARSVADAGWALWDEQYRWSTIQARVGELVRAVAAGG